MTASDALRDTVRYERDDDGVVVLTMDDPEQSANTMNAEWASSFEQAVARLETERDVVTGVIVTSGKPTFFAGGDIPLMLRARPDDAAELTAMLTGIKATLRRLERFGRPVVAAVNGAALGGGLEIALACHHRIALDAKGSTIGLPEVTLGLLPGGGGVTRTVRMLGLAEALTTVLLSGRAFRPRQAADAGLVDDVVETPEAMIGAARAWIAANPGAAQPWDLKGYRMPGGTPSSPALAATLPAFAATLRRQTRGAPAPAPQAILCAAVEGAQVDLETALLIETRYLVRLLTGQVAKNMMTTFFGAMRAVSSGASRPAGVPPTPLPQRVAVLGAGMMGAGIAYACARSGLEVRLKDTSLEVAAAGKGHSQRLVEAAVTRGRMTQEAGEALLARIVPTAETAMLAGCDVLVEAVVEDPAVKQAVYAEAEPVLATGALLASNTSTLPITGLAAGVSRPRDFVGLHFFSPVDRMRLLEVVVGAQTSDATLARALDLAALLGKVPIVVNDSRGFFTSRVIGRFMDEAVRLLSEGVHPASIEQAGLQAGYPTGPLALADEVSLTLIQRIRRAAEAAPGPGRAGAGAPVEAADPARDLVDRMVDEFARPGRAARRGFYEYAEGGARLRLWPGLVEHFLDGRRLGISADATAGIPWADVQERLLFAEAVDAVRCLDEGVLRSVAEADVGSVLGIGFPPWTGGVLQFVAGYAGGVPGFVSRAQTLTDRYGDRFTPPDSLSSPHPLAISGV